MKIKIFDIVFARHGKGGGYVVLGVEERDGKPAYPLAGVPVEKVDAYQKNIHGKCKLIRPAYMPIIEVADYDNKKFIVLWCPGGDNRPYSSSKTMARNNKERIHYIRKGSKTIQPSDEEEKDLFSIANRVSNFQSTERQRRMADVLDDKKEKSPGSVNCQNLR